MIKLHKRMENARHYLTIGRAPELGGRDRMVWRILEILPGALAWGTVLLMVLTARFLPVWAAMFIILFDLYWFLKTLYLSLHLRAGYRTLRGNLKMNWLEKLKTSGMSRREYGIESWRDVYHLVIFPVYREPHEIVRSSFEAIRVSHYPAAQILVVCAVEEAAGAEGEALAEKMREEFSGAFGGFLVTRHPSGLPGEIAGKGANEAWAAREAVEQLVKPRGLRCEQVVVSVFDADTAVFPEFFGCLTYRYLSVEKPLRSSYQPIPLFINNVWQTPAFARIMGFSSTFWQIMQQSRPERLVTFSSHSMGLQPLVEIGYWQTNVVSEDSRIFYQCVLFYDGDWRVEPLHYPVAMDANFAGSFWETAKNQYRQQRRWGYGAENIPYLLFGFMKNPRIPRAQKWHHALALIEGFHSWATHSILIFALGWLPIAIGERPFASSLLSYNLPQITSWIMTVALVGMMTSAVIAMSLMPKRPFGIGKFRYVFLFLQWILMPFSMVILSTIPAIEAQTRLMFGKYLGFWPTPKMRR